MINHKIESGSNDMHLCDFPTFCSYNHSYLVPSKLKENAAYQRPISASTVIRDGETWKKMSAGNGIALGFIKGNTWKNPSTIPTEPHF